jgi:hypothetical protein
MMYKTMFFISLGIFLYDSITGNNDMMEISFKAVVILGLMSILESKR